MLILSLESAGASCSACVWRDGAVLALAEEDMERGQDQRLMPLIVDLMKQSGVTFDALDRIAVTRGPGSFTGLRIGLAAARGIGLAANKPVIGLDRFEIFRDQIKTPNAPVMVIIESKRKELFCRFYPIQGPAHDALMMTPEELTAFLLPHGSVIIAGDKALEGYPLHPTSEPAVVTCARLASKADAASEAYLPRPLYLRAPDVTIKAPSPLALPTSLEPQPSLEGVREA